MSNHLESDSIEELDLTNSPDTPFTPATTHSASPVLTSSGGNEHRTTNANATFTTLLSNEHLITDKLTHNFKSSKLKSDRKSKSKTYRYQPFPRAHAKMSGGTDRQTSRPSSKEPKQDTPAKKVFHLPSAQAKVDDLFRKLSSDSSNITAFEERPQEGEGNNTAETPQKKSSGDATPLAHTPADNITTAIVTTHPQNYDYDLGTTTPRTSSIDSDQMQAPRTPRPTERSLKLNALALAAAQLAPRRPQRKSGRLMEEEAEGEGLASPQAVVGRLSSGGGGVGSPRKAGGGRHLGGK